MIKKVFLLILLVGLLVFLFFKQNGQSIPKIQKSQVKIARPAPIVKNLKIVEEIAREKIDSKEELRTQLDKVAQRDLECKNNDLFFKNHKLNQKNLQASMDELFEKTIIRPQAEVFYQKLMEILESKKNINVDVVFELLRSLEICRYPNALAFLDKIIESKGLKKSIILDRLNKDLLGNHFSSINLALIFGKISRIYSLKLISDYDYRQIKDLRERFLKSEKDFTEILNKSENADQIRDLTIEHLEELKDLGMLLRGELENLSRV